MKIKEGYILREVAGSNIVVPVGTAQINFNGIMTLNEVGTFIWKILVNETKREDIIKAVTDCYEIDEETAAADIDRYIGKLRDKNIIED